MAEPEGGPEMKTDDLAKTVAESSISVLASFMNNKTASRPLQYCQHTGCGSKTPAVAVRNVAGFNTWFCVTHLEEYDKIVDKMVMLMTSHRRY